jgi:hypothetical protein
LRLERNSEKVEEGRPLVKMSAGGGRDMEDPNFTDSDPVANEV